MSTVSTHATTTATPGWYPDPQGAGRRFWDGARWTADVLPGTGSPPPPPVVTAPGWNTSPSTVPSFTAPAFAPAASIAPARRPRLSVLQLGGVGIGFGLLSTLLAWGNGSINGVATAGGRGIDGTAPWLFGGPSSEEIAGNLLYGSSVSGFSDVYILLLLLVGAFVLLWRAQVEHRAAFAKAAAGVSISAAVLMFAELGNFASKANEVSDYVGADVSISIGIGPTAFLTGCILILVGAIRQIRHGGR